MGFCIILVGGIFMNKRSMFWGILLIVVGILFLGRNMNWWDFSIFFDGWWTLFLIVPSIISLVRREGVASSFLILALGVLMLLASQNVIEWSMIWKIFVPLIIIVVGLSIIFGNRRGRKPKANAKEYVAIFSSVDEMIGKIESDFKVTSVFGGVELDMRDVKLEEDLIIDCFTLFGGIDIRLPQGVKVEINGLPIFGGVESKYRNNDEAKVTIYINHTTIFGGVDLI